MNCTFTGQITSIIREPEDLSISTRPINHSVQERRLVISTTHFNFPTIFLDETLERLGATIPGRNYVSRYLLDLNNWIKSRNGSSVQRGSNVNVTQSSIYFLPGNARFTRCTPTREHDTCKEFAG